MNFAVILLLLSASISAETFKIHGTVVEFKEQNGLLVKGCEKPCQALKTVDKFKKIDLKKARTSERTYGSVGSDVCRLIYKENSMIGVAKNLDQRAFCVFRDNSSIEINSLSKFLTDKKIVTE